MILRAILLALFAGFVVTSAYVRLMPIAAKHFAPRPLPDRTGTTKKPGGHRVVMPQPSTAELEKLLSRIAATPRTREVQTDLANTRVFVTRSLIWGFPDVTHVVLTDDALILDSHLVYGQSDLGVNKARIEAWLHDL